MLFILECIHIAKNAYPNLDAMADAFSKAERRKRERKRERGREG